MSVFYKTLEGKYMIDNNTLLKEGLEAFSNFIIINADGEVVYLTRSMPDCWELTKKTLLEREWIKSSPIQDCLML